MDFDCTQEMGKAKRLALAKLTDILDKSGGSLDSDELNDMHHALEALQIIRDLECAETAPAPETPPASGGGGGGNTGGGSTGTDLTGIMAGMEKLLGMVAQLVTAVAGQGNGGGTGNGNGNGGSTPMPPATGGNGETAPDAGTGAATAAAR